MISFDEAYAIVMSRARVLGTEPVDLRDGLGRILAQEVCADADIPPFDKSAMDGYACRRGDLPGPLRIIEVVQAGTAPRKTVGPGECAKIMTGAMLPEGADRVVMLEDTEIDGEGAVRGTRPSKRPQVRHRGEDARAGEVLLRPGAKLGPQHLATLATVGCVRPIVARWPRVGIIATGDELVEPHESPGPSQIRTSNSHQIRAHAESTGALTTYYGIARDEKAAIETALRRAEAENDVVLLSGGVSKGDFDFVPAIMAKVGFEILFDAIALKPGKPTTFAVSPRAYCFGLPGNPVSTFVQCGILVKPFLYALMGHAYRAPQSWLPLAGELRDHSAGRETWTPVRITNENTVVRCEYNGSAHVTGLCESDGFVVIPPGTDCLEKGTLVCVRSI